MRKKHITQMDILVLSVSLFVLVGLWIVFNLYHTWVTSTISKDLQIQIIPIAPKFDTATIDSLKTRERIEPLLQLTDLPITASPSAEPTPTPSDEIIIDTQPTPTEPELTPEL